MPSAEPDPAPSQETFNPARRPAWVRYGVAVVAVLLMTLIRWPLEQLLGDHGRFILFLPAVMVASWYGGLSAATLALLLGAGVGVYLFIFPANSMQITDPVDVLDLILYLASAAMIIIVNEMQRREHDRAERNRRAAEAARSLLEERQAEIEALNAQLRRAVTETYHRVKNNLQVIAALMEMQIQSDGETVSVAELRRLEQHVRALAVINDLLTQQTRTETDVTHLSAEAALKRLLSILPATVGERHIQCDVQTLPLSVKQTTSLALLINELISNAVKHGRGDIHLSLTANADTVVLEVCDEGPGFPSDFDPRRAANTGLDLIDSLSRIDLGGQVIYENRPEGGARVVVTFPLVTAANREKEVAVVGASPASLPAPLANAS